MKLKVTKNKKYLGIDFGAMNVGIAASDNGGNIVFMRGVIKGGGKLTAIFNKVYDICAEESIDVIVFGVPYGRSGQRNKQAERMIRIGEKLKEYLISKGLNIDLVFQDESFSTFEASYGEFVTSNYKLNSKYSDHEMAAKLILEKYLDLINGN